jgi:hypothetical protein
MGRIAVVYVAHKDPDTASRLVRQTIAYSVIVKKFLRDEFVKAQQELAKDPKTELHVSRCPWLGCGALSACPGSGSVAASCSACTTPLAALKR